jgi:hypothetical protein
MASSTPRIRVTRSAVIVMLLGFSLVFSTLVEAATVRHIGTNELVSGSQVIVHGRIVEKWSEAGPTSGTIVTRVVLQITEVIKGADADSTIVLTFLGGTLGDLRQHIDGSNVPDLGEEGIYFLEDPSRFLINPIYGWTQGHFTVTEDRHVRTYAGKSVYGLRAKYAPEPLEFSHHHASGVETEADTKEQEALDVAEFKSLVRAMVESSE